VPAIVAPLSSVPSWFLVFTITYLPQWPRRETFLLPRVVGTGWVHGTHDGQLTVGKGDTAHHGGHCCWRRTL
jgi:hypothetical protein